MHGGKPHDYTRRVATAPRLVFPVARPAGPRRRAGPAAAEGVRRPHGPASGRRHDRRDSRRRRRGGPGAPRAAARQPGPGGGGQHRPGPARQDRDTPGPGRGGRPGEVLPAVPGTSSRRSPHPATSPSAWAGPRPRPRHPISRGRWRSATRTARWSTFSAWSCPPRPPPSKRRSTGRSPKSATGRRPDHDRHGTDRPGPADHGDGSNAVSWSATRTPRPRTCGRRSATPRRKPPGSPRRKSAAGSAPRSTRRWPASKQARPPRSPRRRTR